MADDLNALLDSGSGVFKPSVSVVNPLAAIQAGQTAAESTYNIRKLQAQQMAGQLATESIDPVTKQFDPAAYNAKIAAAGPSVAMYAQPALQDASTLSQTQLQQQHVKAGYIQGVIGALDDNSTPEQVNAVLDRTAANGMFTPTDIANMRAHVPANQADMPAFIQQLRLAGGSVQQQLEQKYGTNFRQDSGGVIVGGTQAPAQRGGALNTAPGGISKTASPDTVVSLPDVRVKATQADVQAGTATEPGQEIYISGAEAKRRQDSGLLPPNAILGTRPPASSGVVNSDGTRASPTNPPRLNVTPPQTTPPAPPVAPTAAAPAAPPVSAGAAISAAPAAPAAPLPLPPTPPAVVPPPAAATTVAPPPPTSPPDPYAAQKAQAKATGQEVPIPGGQGLVAKPDGLNIGPPNRDSMMPKPRADLSGGVPVASTNALQPNVGPAGPPGPAVSGDVDAILAGMNRARAAPSGGTQQAVGGSGSFAAGPGYDEQVNATTSQERLATDSKLAASYAGNVFPYTQALAGYGRGMTTAPGSDFLNAAKGFAGGVLRSVGVNTPLSDDAASYDAQHKWLSQIITGNPVAQGSDARLAATLAGNANTGIHELAGADMMKAGIALMRMTAAARAEWDDPQVRAKYGYYNDFLRDFNKTVDPRAFAWDMYNPEQKKTLIDDLNAHRSDPTYAKKLQDSLALVRRNGYLGETRAMP